MTAKAGGVLADAGALDSPGRHRRGRGGGDLADPGGRRRARGPHQRRAPGARRLGGRRRPAGAAGRLPARLRGAARPARPAGRARTATSATAACTCRIDFPFGPAADVGRRAVPGRSSRTPPGWSPATAARCPASTATAGPAASCCRSCTPPPSSGCSSRSRRCSTRTTCSTPACWSARPGSTTTSGWPRRPVVRSGLALAYRHDGGDFSAAVHRCTGVGKCRADLAASGGVMCPSWPATREEKDTTRGRARVLQEMLAPGGPVRRTGGRPRCTTRSTSACPARAARATARPGSTWPPTRPRCCTSPTGAGCARVALHARPAAPLGRPRRPRAPAGQRGCSLPARRPAGEVVGGHGPAPRGAAVRAAHLPPGVGGARPGPAGGHARWRCGWTRSPTTSPRRWRSRPRGAGGGGLPRAGARRRHLLRPDLDHHRASSTPRGGSSAPRSRPWRRSSTPGIPDRRGGAVVHRRAAQRGAGAGRRAGGRAGRRAAPARWPSCSRPPRAGSRRRLTGLEVVAQPHCHHASVLGWSADARLLARPAPR